jgi:hypothetical protein
MLSWIPPKVTKLHGNQENKFFRQDPLRRTTIRKCLDQISSGDVEVLEPNAIADVGNLVTCLSSLKVFRSESQDVIPLRGEGCNTPGVRLAIGTCIA